MSAPSFSSNRYRLDEDSANELFRLQVALVRCRFPNQRFLKKSFDIFPVRGTQPDAPSDLQISHMDMVKYMVVQIRRTDPLPTFAVLRQGGEGLCNFGVIDFKEKRYQVLEIDEIAHFLSETDLAIAEVIRFCQDKARKLPATVTS